MINNYGKYNNILAERFRKIREDEGLTREQLAERLYCTPQAIYNYESANRQIKPQIACLMAGLFHIDADYLLDTSVKFRTKSDELKDLFGKASQENSLMHLAICSLATLYGYEVQIRDLKSEEGNVEDVLSSIKKYMIFLKAGEELFSLSVEEVNNLGNFIANSFDAGIELLGKKQNK